MFSPLTPAEMVTAIGRATHAAARSDEPAGAFSSGQLMSAYSASRHLSAEIAAFPAALAAFVAAVAEDLAAHGRMQAQIDALAAAPDDHAVGYRVAELLATLRADGSPAAAALRVRVCHHLRALSDREVELLAEVVEGPRA